MDPSDDELDEDDIEDRDYLHGIMTFHILLLLLMELIYVVLHVAASFWLTDFYMVNPIFLFISMDGAVFIVKRCFSRRMRQQANEFHFTSILMTIALISLVLQISLAPEDSLSFVFEILQLMFGSLVTTFTLCSLLITILA